MQGEGGGGGGGGGGGVGGFLTIHINERRAISKTQLTNQTRDSRGRTAQRTVPLYRRTRQSDAGKKTWEDRLPGRKKNPSNPDLGIDGKKGKSVTFQEMSEKGVQSKGWGAGRIR